MQPDGFRPHPTPDGGLAELLGPLHSRRDGDVLRFGLACDGRHTNAMSAVHGGLLMTFADQVLGLTVQDALQTNRVATVSMNCEFVAGVRPGQWIEGTAKIVRVTASLVFVEGAIFRDEAVVLTASGVWYRRPGAGQPATEGEQGT